MARRRVELQTAVKAGQKIGEGKDYPDVFNKVDLQHDIKLDPNLGGVFSLQYSFDGKLLAVGYGNGGIQLFSSTTGEMVKEIRQTRHGGYAVMCMRFHPKEHYSHILLAATAEGIVYCINTEDGTIKQSVTEKKNEINCFDFCDDGFYFATAGKDLAVRVYDTSTFQLDKTYDGYSNTKPPNESLCEGCSQRVFALKFRPSHDDIFITGGWEGHLKVWDTRSNDGVKKTIWGPHICGDSLDVQESRILTGSWVAGAHDDALQIWGYTDGNLQKNIPFPNDKGAYLYCAQFCDNDVVLAGGSGTNSVCAMNVKTKECLGSIQMTKPVQALDSAMGGRFVAVGGQENSLKLGSLS